MSWKKLTEQIVYNGYRKIIQKRFRLPSGKEADFDVVQGGDFVTIAAFTPTKEAILVSQYRPGPEQSLISFPEGAIEKGEDVLVSAARELEEETGYRARKIIYLKTFRMAYRVDRKICVLAVDCEKVGPQRLDDTEFIEVFTLPLEKFKQLLTNPTDESFTTVDAAFLALQYFKKNRDHFVEKVENRDA